jgi:hypothetical protein
MAVAGIQQHTRKIGRIGRAGALGVALALVSMGVVAGSPAAADTRPVITITSPVDKQQVWRKDPLTVTGTVTGLDTLAGVPINIRLKRNLYNEGKIVCSTTTDASGNFTCELAKKTFHKEVEESITAELGYPYPNYASNRVQLLIYFDTPTLDRGVRILDVLLGFAKFFIAPFRTISCWFKTCEVPQI